MSRELKRRHGYRANELIHTHKYFSTLIHTFNHRSPRMWAIWGLETSVRERKVASDNFPPNSVQCEQPRASLWSCWKLIRSLLHPGFKGWHAKSRFTEFTHCYIFMKWWWHHRNLWYSHTDRWPGDFLKKRPKHSLCTRRDSHCDSQWWWVSTRTSWIWTIPTSPYCDRSGEEGT